MRVGGFGCLWFWGFFSLVAYFPDAQAAKFLFVKEVQRRKEVSSASFQFAFVLRSGQSQPNSGQSAM